MSGHKLYLLAAVTTLMALTKNSACKDFAIAIKFTLSPIQNILFCKIEAVIRLSVLKKTSFGN
jgi:hypothetical protein